MMKCGPGLGLVLASLALLAGCDDPGGQSSAGVARDSAGVRIVDLPLRSMDEPVAELTIDPSWTPSAGLEIGDLSDIDLVPGRGILLLDELAVNVTVLSESGDLLAVIGRTGQGPGEFDPQGLRGMVATDSSVFVPDLFLQRLTEFTLAGEVLGIQTFPYTPVYAVDWRSHPGGGLVFRALEQFGDQIIRWVGETVDTILSVPISNESTNLLLPPSALWDLTDEGDVLLGRSDRGAVELRREGTGEMVWRAQWADQARELEDDAVAHLEDLVRETILRETPQISAELLAQNLAMIEYPTSAPLLAGIMAAPGGDVWVRRARPVGEMGPEALLIGSVDGYGSRVWDVLDSGGFFKARVRLPEGFTPRRFLGEWAYGILADELGIETAARVRVSL
ncbi:hypothetical protein ACFL0I_00155 [Gemmatimonadota bacterium]